MTVQGDANDEEKRTEGVSTPDARDVKAIFRRTNWIFGIGLGVLALISIVGIFVAVGGRAASRDSFNSTAVALANQERSACITERRNAELDALGRMTAAGLRAQIAAFVEGDDAEALRQVAILEKAANDRDEAAALLAPEVQNAPKSQGGCGPPIVTLEDLEEEAKR